MVSRCMAVTAVIALLLWPAMVGAQWISCGDPDMKYADMTSGGLPPVTLQITGLNDIPDYAFDGSDLEIPFTLEGTGATVWLIIYTVGQHPPLTITGEGPAPYRDPEHAAPGWHVYDDVDTLVYKSAGERFDEGDNVIVWNGRDMNGNIVPAGRYDLFLAAFDDEAIPHVVAGTGGGGHPGTCASWYVDLNREIMYKIGEGMVFKMRNDWIENQMGYDTVDQSAVEAAVGDRGFGTTVHSATPMNLPDATEWIGHLYGNGGAIIRYSFDWDALAITPHEDWALDAGAEAGVLPNGDKTPGRQCASVWNSEENIIYASGGVSGTVGKIAGWDAATGELVKDWDFSDLMMYDNKGSDRVQGPENLSKFPTGEYDPYGMATCSHHGSVEARIDYTGKIRWINRNGDGFGDQREYSTEAGTIGDYVYGHTEAPSFKYTVYSTKWGWTSYPQNGLDTINHGMVLGEDGSGLFFFQPKHIPMTWPDHVIIIDKDSPWDGVILNVGSIGTGRDANDFEGDPMVFLPYDQKRVTLGPAQAVEEIETSKKPKAFALGNAYPNPFNPETTIQFSLPWEVQVTVKIYNAQGQFVRDLVNEQLGPGRFTLTWDGTDAQGATVASGVYTYKIEVPGLRMSKQVTFLK